MKQKIQYQLIKLNTFDINALETIWNNDKISRKGILKRLEVIGFQNMSQQYLSQEARKMVSMGILMEEGQKPKYYKLNPELADKIMLYISALRILENSLAKERIKNELEYIKIEESKHE
jgi:hypothetical protein